MLRYTAVAAGEYFSLALRTDGRVVGWGKFLADAPSQMNGHVFSPPVGQEFVAVAAGGAHGLGLLSGGTVTGWGSNVTGELDVPPLPGAAVYVDIAAGDAHSLARRSDGVLVGWGNNGGFRRPDSATFPAHNRLLAIGATSFHSLALIGLQPAAVATAPAQVTYGQGFSIGAVVHLAGQAATPNPAIPGSVRLRVGGSVVATSTLAGGAATFTVGPTALAAGTHSATVEYLGAPGHLTATSAPVSIVVAPAVTAAAVAWPKSWRYGKSAKATVRVTAPGTGVVPRGRVEIRSGSKVLGAANLKADGTAVVTLKKLGVKPGKRTLRAFYLGAATTAPATSASRAQTVTRAKTAVSVKLVRKAVKRTAKPRITIRAKASGVVPRGTVQVKVGKKVVRTVKLTAKHRGTRTVSIPRVSKVGKHTVRVVFLATKDFTKKTSKPKTLTVRR